MQKSVRSVLFSRCSIRNSSTFKFASAIECIRTDGNNFTANLAKSWNIGDSPNGGYVMSVAINAAQQCQKLQDPLSFTAYYLTKADVGPADISVEVLSSSNSTSTVQVSLSQGGVLRSRYMGVFGDLSRLKGISHSALSAPELPNVSDCLDGNECLRKNVGDHLQIAINTEFRLSREHPFAKNFLLNGKVSTEAYIDCWLSFPDGEIPTPESFPLFLDCYPPVLNIIASNWIPTMDYTIHTWCRPSSEHFIVAEGKHWIRARFATDFVKNSLLYTDAQLWSADGQVLLGTARQMAKIWIPKSDK